LTDRIHHTLQFEPAQERDIRSVENWVDGTGCLDRQETAYLSVHRDLIQLAPSADSAITKLESWVEDALIRFYKSFRQVNQRMKNKSEYLF
jgi:hypothetical protein